MGCAVAELLGDTVGGMLERLRSRSTTGRYRGSDAEFAELLGDTVGAMLAVAELL
jgi:hypothetical protein